MDSVNELLKLFMRQARQERVPRPASDTVGSEAPSGPLERPGNRFSNDAAQIVEALDHDGL